MNGDRLTDHVQVVILVGMGGLAGAASFRHVHDLAAAHGQAGWFAWAAAVSIEAMSIAAGLEIRRSHRTGRSATFPTLALAGGVALSLAAQVAQAERSAWGWIVAAVPAAAFLTVLKFALRRLDPTTPHLEPVITPEPAPSTVHQPETPALQANPATAEAAASGSVATDLTAYLAAR